MPAVPVGLPDQWSLPAYDLMEPTTGVALRRNRKKILYLWDNLHMILSRIQLHNYRAYPSATMDLPPNGVVLLAGANNSGKSAFLSALDAVLRGTTFADMGYGGASDWRIELTFQTTADEREKIAESFTPYKSAFSGHHVFNLIRVTYASSQFGVRPVELSFGPDARSLSVLARMDVDKRMLLVTNHLMDEKQGDASVLREVLGGVDGVNQVSAQYPPIGLMFQGINELSNGFYHFEALRPGAPPTATLASAPTLDPTGVNLPAVLRHLRDNDSAAFNKVATALADLVPELGELGFRSAGNQDEIVFTEPAVHGLRQNLQNLGTGVEQLLLTLVVGIAQPQAKTILIEEPETALEAGAQRALLGLLQQWSTDRLFIVSTHSTAMIDWSSSTSGQLYYVRRKDGKSNLFKLRDKFQGLLSDLGVRLSDVLSAETILITEGSTDRKILGVFFPRLLQTPHIAIVPGGGGDNARLAPILQAWLKDADAMESRRVVFLRDRDELSPEQVSELEEKGVVRVLPQREIENYLLSDAALYGVFSEAGASVTSQSDVADALREVADSLKERVVLGRVWWQLPRIRLADNTLRSDLADEPDKLTKLIDTTCGVLPSREDLETQIRKLWAEAEKSVEAEWPDRWKSLAPGEDVLQKLYTRFLGRDFVKATDGPTLARAVLATDGVPPELERLLADL